MKKIALFFPGIGYTAERPLLYYARKIAAAAGFETYSVNYGAFPEGAKDSAEKMQQAFEHALSQAEAQLAGAGISGGETVLCVSKSIGTPVAAAYTARHGLNAQHIYYTPIEKLFDFPVQEGIVFHGSGDPWMQTALLSARCAAEGLPLTVIPGANHSLETGDAAADIAILADVMRKTADYVGRIGAALPGSSQSGR